VEGNSLNQTGDLCPANAVCVNKPGWYRCECKEGFQVFVSHAGEAICQGGYMNGTNFVESLIHDEFLCILRQILTNVRRKLLVLMGWNASTLLVPTSVDVLQEPMNVPEVCLKYTRTHVAVISNLR